MTQPKQPDKSAVEVRAAIVALDLFGARTRDDAFVLLPRWVGYHCLSFDEAAEVTAYYPDIPETAIADDVD
jgi:hypothetical protein